MLYSTLNQPLVFCILFFSGGLCSVFFIFIKLFKKNFIKQIYSFFSIILSFVIFTIANLFANYGQFRFYTILSFLTGLTVFYFIFKFLWTKLCQKCYNFKNGRKEKKEKT